MAAFTHSIQRKGSAAPAEKITKETLDLLTTQKRIKQYDVTELKQAEKPAELSEAPKKPKAGAGE